MWTLRKAKNPKNKDEDPVKAYENMIEDFDYQEQQLMIHAHMSMNEFENADYYRLIEVMSAKPRKDRAQDLEDIFG